MSQLLILGSAILAADATETADSFITSDQIIPKSVIAGYSLVTGTLPAASNLCDWNGTSAVLRPPVVVPPVVPQSVSPRQIRQALTATPCGTGTLRSAVESAVSAGSQDLKDWYAYSTEFVRSNNNVIAMGTALGLTSAQLDSLWILAGSL